MKIAPQWNEVYKGASDSIRGFGTARKPGFGIERPTNSARPQAASRHRCAGRTSWNLVTGPNRLWPNYWRTSAMSISRATILSARMRRQCLWGSLNSSTRKSSASDGFRVAVHRLPSAERWTSLSRTAATRRNVGTDMKRAQPTAGIMTRRRPPPQKKRARHCCQKRK